MAILEGGLHGPANGSVGNITYSEARTKEGKITTAREKVDPANPKTEAQKQQRGKFSQAQNLIQLMGPKMYRDDFNRSVGDLPGFQSLQSIFLDNLDDQGKMSPPSDIILGSLDHLAGLSMSVATSSPHVSLTYDPATGELGTSSDKVVAFAFQATAEGDNGWDYAESVAVTDRAGSPIELTLDALQTGESVIAGVYVRGAGSAEGLLSPCKFLSKTA